MKEETGAVIEVLDNMGSFDYLGNAPYNGCEYTHHISLLYRINILYFCENSYENYVYNNNQLVPNDAVYKEWVDIGSFNEKNASPLVIKVCEIINNGYGNNDIAEYLTWRKSDLQWKES